MKKVFFNLDSDWFLHSRGGTLPDIPSVLDEVDEEYLREFIDSYADVGVTDFLMCVNITLSAFPSRVRMSYMDKARVTEELGQTVDYSHTVCETFRRIWEEKGLDYFAIWLARCRERGLTSWLSFRMNDAHCHFELPNHIVSQDFYKHVNDYSRVRHREQVGYFDRCHDFALEEVRREWLAYITETLERYDPDGIELDFQREYDCFAIGGEWVGREIMTAFMGEVKSLVSSFEEKRGHRIRIGVRLHPDPVCSQELGFDAAEWAKRGYLDLVVPTARWRTVDGDIPIRLWRQLLEPYGVEVVAGLEWLIDAVSGFDYSRLGGEFPFNTVETALGYAAAYYAEGAEGIYLFNYFDTHKIMRERHAPTGDDNLLSTSAGYYRLLSALSDTEAVEGATRRHVLTYRDRNPLWSTETPPLPREMRLGKYEYFRLAVGKVGDERKPVLRVGVRGDASPLDLFTVYVNSAPIHYEGEVTLTAPVLTDSRVYAYSFPASVLKGGVAVMEFVPKDTVTVDYLDITVK